MACVVKATPAEYLEQHSQGDDGGGETTRTHAQSISKSDTEQGKRDGIVRICEVDSKVMHVF